MRLGFVTGPKPLVERINLHMQVSVLQASSLSQVRSSRTMVEGSTLYPPFQCVQIEQFLKVFVTNFLTIEAQIFGHFLGYF